MRLLSECPHGFKTTQIEVAHGYVVDAARDCPGCEESGWVSAEYRPDDLST